MIKGSIYRKIIAILSIYASKNRVPKHMKQSVTDSRVEIDSSMIIVRDHNSILSVLDRTTRNRRLE